MRHLPVLLGSLLVASFVAPATAAAATLLAVDRSGGFYYTSVQIEIATDGTYVKTDTDGTCTGSLTAAEVVSSRMVVTSTRRYTATNRKFPDACCDLYAYAVTSRFGTTTFTPDGFTVLPVSIESAADFIDDLINTTCSTTSSSS